MTLLDYYRRNVYSQNGEDGVLGEILRRLGIASGTFVEFGAWDGITYSNTRHLLEQGWGGVYIESDPTKFAALVCNCAGLLDRVQLVHATVTQFGESSLDRILARTKTPRCFEVLSIDIDGLDLQIWDSVTEYSPTIVVIEVNSQIPMGVHQVHGPGAQGASLTSMVELGHAKGYALVCHTGNAIFVRSDLVPRLVLTDAQLADHYRALTARELP